MVEDSFKYLMPSSVITDKLPEITEAFVDYYGEHRREEITNRLNSLTILKFGNLIALEDNIKQVGINLFKEIYNIDAKEYITPKSDELVDYLESEKPPYFFYLTDRVKEIISGNKEISEEDIRENYRKGAYPKLREFVSRYKAIKPRLEPYKEQLRIERENEKRIVEEYNDLFYQEMLDLFQKNGFDINDPKIKAAVQDWLIDSNGNAFDDEAEKCLHDPSTPGWKINPIIRDRVKKIHAIYDPDKKYLNGPTYDDYLNDPECQVIINKLRSIGQPASIRAKDLSKKINIDCVEALEDYKTNRAVINTLNLVDKNDSLGPFCYNSSVSVFQENYTKTPDGFVLSPLVLINSGMSQLDLVILHELNHALEYHPFEVTDEGCKATCGWDINETKFEDHRTDENVYYTGITRGYELLSEYVNDKLAEEVMKLMHSKGHYIFDIRNHTSSSSYRSVAILVGEFYETYKDIIIESRHNGNIQYLFDNIGKENFEELNNLVNDFYKRFGWGIGLTLNDLRNGKDTKDTRDLNEMIARKDEIMSRIKEFKEAKTL